MDPEGARTETLLAEWSRCWRGPLLNFFARRLRPDIDREDLVQEVFLRLAKRGELETVEKVETYLFQTAASVLSDHLRARRVRAGVAHLPLPEDLISDADMSPEHVLLGKEAVEVMARALAELPARTQAIFALYHFEDMPHRDIAKRLGVSVSTVEKEMGKANRHLMSKLEWRR